MTVRVNHRATGTVAALVLGGIIRNPALNLAGLHVYNPEKVSRDAAELFGAEAIGVSATPDVCSAEPGIFLAPIFAAWKGQRSRVTVGAAGV